MNLGNNLYQARRKTGYSQEEVAAKIGVSRQTISKWETNETIPDIFQSKKMALMYGIALDDLSPTTLRSRRSRTRSTSSASKTPSSC